MVHHRIYLPPTIEAMGESSAPRSRGFDVLRIIAASAVLVGHAYLLTGSDLFPVAFGDTRYALGALGVFVFFSVSGFLIAGSWVAKPDVRVFALKRFLRIWPALAVMVLLTTVVVGPLFTSHASYFTESGPWVYALRNLFVIPYQQVIPGVFAGNLFPETNGVIWTLGVEVVAYVGVAVVGLLGIIKNRPHVLLALAVICALAGWPALTASLLPEPVVVRVGLFAFFLLGAWVKAARIRVALPVACGFVLLAAGLAVVGAPASISIVPAVTFATLYLGQLPMKWSAPVVSKGDPSYGAYIYGYPLQQILVALGVGTGNTAAFAGLSVALGLGMGYLSWHLLEKRALRWKPTRRRGAHAALPELAQRN